MTDLWKMFLCVRFYATYNACNDRSVLDLMFNEGRFQVSFTRPEFWSRGDFESWSSPESIDRGYVLPNDVAMG